MTDFLALARECEKAPNGNRDLSDRIIRAFGWRTERHGFKNINGSTEAVDVWLAPGKEFRREDFEWLAQEAANNMWSYDGDHRPDPSLSLDASRELVKAAVNASGLRLETQSSDAGAWARLSWHQGGWGPDVEARANTLELALSALALKARVERDRVSKEYGVPA